ncbi:MAG: CBS domain-containing protein [Algicola sp.]|nr:CBS domain-containing protein [Algicola sp.]
MSHFSQHIGSLPIVTADGYLQGIVTRSDILRSMIKHGPLEFWA